MSSRTHGHVSLSAHENWLNASVKGKVRGSQRPAVASEIESVQRKLRLGNKQKETLRHSRRMFIGARASAGGRHSTVAELQQVKDLEFQVEGGRMIMLRKRNIKQTSRGSIRSRRMGTC